MSLYRSTPVTLTRVLVGLGVFAGCVYAGREVLIRQAGLEPELALKGSAIFTTIVLAPLILTVTARLQRRPPLRGPAAPYSLGRRD